MEKKIKSKLESRREFAFISIHDCTQLQLQIQIESFVTIANAKANANTFIAYKMQKLSKGSALVS